VNTCRCKREEKLSHFDSTVGGSTTDMPSSPRIVGYAEPLYKRMIKPWLPSTVHQALRRIHQRANARFAVWRVQAPVTRLLGPQYRRSREYIEIDITYACNLNCYNCNRSCEQAATGDHMTVEQIRLFVKESVAANYRWKRIRLLGGEPTLHKEFFEILDVLRQYRDEESPGTIIEVSTNGHGEKVNAAIAKIPPDVVVNNTAKATKIQPHFSSFNIAPRDLPRYQNADFHNGCWVTEFCGIGLGPNGYYVCAVASGIDRIYGWNVGLQKLPLPSDNMEAHLERFCSHCGHFKREPEAPLEGPVMSGTWKTAYARYMQQRSTMTRYIGSAARQPKRRPDRPASAAIILPTSHPKPPPQKEALGGGRPGFRDSGGTGSTHHSAAEANRGADCCIGEADRST
jgi:Radical SAM superfamily/4Fe-4S single cluster domain